MISGKDKEELIKKIKAQLDNIILAASPKNKANTVSFINTSLIDKYISQGITFKGWSKKQNKYDIVGYSRQSIYRKILKRKVYRKIRKDQGEIRNLEIKNNFEKIKEYAPILYFTNKIPSLKELVRIIVKHLKLNNKSSSSLYKRFNIIVKKSGCKNHHEYFQKYYKINHKDYSLTEPKEKEYFAGKSKRKLGMIIEESNKDSDIEKKAEKFLTLIKERD